MKTPERHGSMAKRDQTAGLALFENEPIPDPPPAPPSGPRIDPPSAESNSRLAYDRWRQTLDGIRVYSLIERRALALVEHGATRISVNALAESVRLKFHLEVNNTYRAYIADDLVEAHPKLVECIERRKRHT